MDKRSRFAGCCTIAYMIGLIIITIIVYCLPSRNWKRAETCFEQDGTVLCETSEIILSMNQKLDRKYKDLLKKESETKDKAAEAVFSSTSVNRLIPAALYIGTSLDEKEIENIPRPCPITAWDRAVNRPGLCGFQRYGIGIHNGRIIVPVGGLYHVYSFFNFFEEFPSANSSANIEKPGIDHGIYRFNIKDGEEKRLVSLVHPHQFPFRRAFNIYSSYVSLFVELKAGDEVSIKVNYPEYIRNTEINLFGLTLV